MRLKKIVKLFETRGVCVVGQRGRGKDLLMSNVVVRRGVPYVSNIDYTQDENYRPYCYSDIDINNSFRNFTEGTITPYTYPYGDGVDIYLSDAGVYFPSQYNEQLNKLYPSLPSFFALSRHLGDCSVHFNAQNLNRVWDKIREQCDTFINCDFVFKPLVKLGIVVQRVTIYDKPQSCIDKVEPFLVPRPFLAIGQKRLDWEIERARYRQQYGNVERRWFVYVNKSTYDSRRFKTMLQGD